MKKTTSRFSGFTIVELLIVVVVIAILAAISTVAYSNIQNRANNSAVEADIASIIKKMEMVKVELGHYPRSNSEFPDGFKFSKSAYDQTQNNIYYLVDIQNDRYALGVRSKPLRGYVINTGSVAITGTVHSGIVATSLGIPWENNDGVSFVAVGYSATSGNWASGWNWTN